MESLLSRNGRICAGIQIGVVWGTKIEETGLVATAEQNVTEEHRLVTPTQEKKLLVYTNDLSVQGIPPTPA